MHCFVKDVPLCLAALSSRGAILTSMDLVLTNIANSPPLEKIFKASKVHIESESFSRLTELSMDSSHLTHVNLSGTIDIKCWCIYMYVGNLYVCMYRIFVKT